MRIKLVKIFFIYVLLTGLRGAYALEPILVWDRLQDNPVAYQILKLALNKTVAEHGEYRLQSSIAMEQGRVTLELEKNRSVHIANFAPEPKREARLLPIRIPVTQGLLGYRVCLIKDGTQERFNGIDGLLALNEKKIRIGQGEHWPDTTILRENNISVVSSAKYKTLFNMLKRNRFDCFSRSVSEIMPEAEQYQTQGLVIEKTLLLVYRLPTFFFVSKKNPQLAERVQLGLKRGLRDGSISKLIDENYRHDFKRLNLKDRNVIYLSNSNFTEKTRAELDSFKYWFKPSL